MPNSPFSGPVIQCDVLIAGGGAGGCAAALALTNLGLNVVMTEPTEWVGGQLTNQIVPPDEHPWIESFGCTRRYREFRNRVRQYYRDHYDLTTEAFANPNLNPGGGWVSRLCYEPRVGWQVLLAMLEPALTSGLLDLRLGAQPIRAFTNGDRVEAVEFSQEGTSFTIQPKTVIDATETGDLLPLARVEYAVGAESQAETGEPSALSNAAEWDNVQGITWCAVFSHDPSSHRVIDQPAEYEKWRTWVPSNWCGPMLSLTVADPFKGGTRVIPVMGEYGLMTYRQIVNPSAFKSLPPAATAVNWPQNDFFDGTILDVPTEIASLRLEGARQLTLSLLYWLQTEAGFPGLYFRPDLAGTKDGLAMAPYIRESRRIRALFTVREDDVSAAAHPGQDRANPLPKSVGIGCYRLDLHPGANGAPTLDLSTVPFQIPLGSLIPVRVKNLLAGGKNLGVTHITNGCYRLHPIEWNVGESAGLLVGFALLRGLDPVAVFENEALWAEFESLLWAQGIETAWPADQVLKAV